MTSKKWLFTFALSLLLILVLLIAFNIAVDPFGVFGDPFFDWYSFNFTSNRRVAKIAYLQQVHEQFDSFILGASGSSAYSVHRLSEYMDASFYNMFFIGADMSHLEQTAQYLIENYTVRNLVIGVSISNGLYFDRHIENPRTQSLHVNAAGGSRFAFYWQYLWLNPQYAFDKIVSFLDRGYLPGQNNWYNTATGAFDKRAREAIRIGCIEDYFEIYPEFETFSSDFTREMTQIDNTIASLTRIRDMVEAVDGNLLLIFNPLYYGHFFRFTEEDVGEFFTKLADVAPFWDFTLNPFSWEPRFFYDPTHFREALGNMVLARIFDDDSVYVPEDFGTLITPDNVAAHLEQLFTVTPLATEAYTTTVPVLMYHHISDTVQSSMDITPEVFEMHMSTLYEHGFTTITLQALLDYVHHGVPLPEQPVLITFDDGYLSVYEYAFPVLERYGQHAVSFVIGMAVGTSYYRDTNYPTTPKFCFEQAERMSGVMDIQSHSYDMHQWAPFEPGRARENILIWDDECEWEYAELLRQDHRSIVQLVYENLGTEVYAIAFPLGHYDLLSQAVLQSEGMRISFSSRPAVNTLITGMPQSLLSMGRFNMTNDMSAEALLKIVGFDPKPGCVSTVASTP